MSSILLAEDSPTHARLIQRLLEDAGHDVVCAGDGEEALQLIEKSMPELLVTDLRMPKIDGVELVGRVAQQFTTLPSVVVTARGSESLAVDALAKGAANFVPKDSLAKLLVRTVRQTIQLARIDAAISPATVASNQHDGSPYEWTVNLRSNPVKIEPIVWSIVQTVAATGRLNPTERMRLGIAILGSLFNAVCFGNLCLPDDDELIAQFLADDPRWHETFKSRQAESDSAKLEVTIRVSVGQQDTRIAVRHEGNGRGARLTPAPGTPESFEVEQSRHLMLITSFMDDVMFRSDATEMVMVKNHTT